MVTSELYNNVTLQTSVSCSRFQILLKLRLTIEIYLRRYTNDEQTNNLNLHLMSWM